MLLRDRILLTSHNQSMYDCKYLIMGEKIILNLHCCKPKATAVDLPCSQNQALSLKVKLKPTLTVDGQIHTVIAQDLVSSYESGRQLKL